jgi:CRISPR-associated protein Csb1
MKLSVDRLTVGCGDDSTDSGVRIWSSLEPLGGPGAPVKPAVYEGGKFQRDRRWWGAGQDRQVTDVIVIDNVPSQANRIEAALRRARAELGLPELVVDLGSVPGLPVHLPRELSSFEFPHRNGDAYLRDAELDGVPFGRSDVGRRIFEATSSDPAALFEWMPQALLFGYWQSHLGKKRQQTKLARSWVSEIVGYEPAAIDTESLGLKGDPLNLSIDTGLAYDEDDQIGWELTDSPRKGARSKDSLAEIGHGQVPVANPASGVSFRAIEQQASVSFAGLRRVWVGSAEANAVGRALLAAIGLAGHVLAFGGGFSLRSGCDLRPVSTRWQWIGGDLDDDCEPLTLDAAVSLVADCAGAAEKAGLPVGDAWDSDPLVLLPQKKLADVIARSWPVAEDD